MKLLFEIKVRYMNFKLLMHNVNVSNVFIQDAISFELFNFVLVLHMEHFQFFILPYYKFRHSNRVYLAFSDLLHMIFYQNKMLVSSFYDRCTGKFQSSTGIWCIHGVPPKNKSFDHKFIT